MTSPITPSVVFDLTTVSEPNLSGDGTHLLFTQSWIDNETLESRSVICLIPTSDLATRSYTYTRGEHGFTMGPKDSMPRFSPNSQSIAFLRADAQGKRQIWIIPSTGGEPHQVTTMPGGVSEFAWSPTGSKLAFVSDVDPNFLTDPTSNANTPQVKIVRRIKYRGDTVGWRGDAHWHIFLVDPVNPQGADPEQLTDGDWDDHLPTWSPDGQHIAFLSSREDNRDLVANTECYVVPQAGGEPTSWSNGLSSIAAIAWAPDGDRLAVIGSDDEALGAGIQGGLFLLTAKEQPKRITPDTVRPIGGAPPISPAPDMRWARDGRIVFGGDARGESHLYELREDSGEIRKIGDGGMQITAISLDSDGRRAAVLGASPTSAGDLYWFDVNKKSHTQITNQNSDYFSEHPTATVEKFSTTRDGVQVECRLLFPPNFDPTSSYPLIVDIHGGPHGAFYDTFEPVQQVLATSGYIVLLVNPRGSSTYDAEFTKAVHEDWGGEDYQDIITAVESVCERPYIDTKRLGVHGYSYGGFMTSWTIGHTTRFKAAVVGAPCINLHSMYGTSDIGVSFGERQWGGTWWDHEEAFRAHSPLTFVTQVETPVLLLHGEDDVRCPIEQSEQYFVALKRLNKEVEFVRFPGCSHLFRRSGHPLLRTEYISRTLGWFDRFIGHS